MEQLRTRINLEAIAHNATVIRGRLNPGTRLMAVVKADAYNHGAVEVARRLTGVVDAFGVATAGEALELRRAGIDAPILCWLWAPGDTVIEAAQAGIELGVPSMRQLRWLIDGPVHARVSLKVETGMHRAGIDEDSWPEAFRLARDADTLEVTGVFSHLACADDLVSPATERQAQAFERAIACARELGVDVANNHLANSAATLARPDLHHDQVRVGLALYGIGDPELVPALSFSAEVLAIKPIAAGEGVSYGHTFVADRPGFIALIPAGYADGIPRSAQGKIEATIKGRRYQQIGRVCMDQIVVDLGDNPHAVASGDEAIIFGRGGMGVEEFAESMGTIPYEVLCLPKGRTHRYFKESDED